GFYIYRNDRLLQHGGWSSVTAASKDLRLARVAIDLGEDLLDDVAINPEKHGVTLRPDFVAALEDAVDATGDATFRTFLADARETAVDASKRDRHIKPAAAIASGLPDEVVSAVEATFRFRSDEPEISLGWRTLDA